MKNPIRWASALCLAIGLLPACSGPSCQEVAERVIAIEKGDLPADEMRREVATAEEYCRARKLTKSQRRCLTKAQSLDGIDGCFGK